MHFHSPDITPNFTDMNMDAFTTTEIKQKIDMFKDRIAVLKDIIKDIKDPATRGVLQVQKNNYQTSLDAFEKELSSRGDK